jgi:bifunctional non-homologous end joining protein LigD
MGLKEYKAKRNFSRTKEPAGDKPRAQKHRDPLFVIQKHDATRLHYDFRLEMEGVLKSWAVPKGLPMRRGDRRLAVQVEDHPLDYGDFEGTIPEGNYGAGTVMVWDIGSYSTLGGDPLAALKSGKIHFTLKGKKLKGDWALVRMRQRDENKPQWLILKSGTDLPELSAQKENQSALTKRTLDQIASKNSRQWQSNRATSSSRRLSTLRINKPAAPRPEVTTPEVNLARLPPARPRFVEPMKAILVEDLPKGDQWIYELKFDGVRAIGIKDKRRVELISRAEKDLTTKYPKLAAALEKLPAREAVLDGEIVAVDETGRSSFQLLQSYQMAGSKKPPLLFYVFDLINFEGKDLTGLPLIHRKAIAESLVRDRSSLIRFSSSIKADSERLMNEMRRRGLEGLIAKRKDSKYEIGRRSGAWAKFKWTNEQEFVIGGFTRPQGARSHFGALLVGYYEGSTLLFAAKVGTGFGEKVLSNLHTKFQKLIRKDCPFDNLPEKLPHAGGRGLTAAEMRHCTWLEPKLVCQVRFSEWTRDHHLRQPAFLGLREDKRPKEVIREKPR